jgi:hypothetical protein
MAIPKHPRNTRFAHEDHPFRNPEIIATYHLLETPSRLTTLSVKDWLEGRLKSEGELIKERVSYERES